MRAYIKDNKLHVVTQEYEKLVGLDGKTEIPEEETVFDEVWTEVARKAFYNELIRGACKKVNYKEEDETKK